MQVCIKENSSETPWDGVVRGVFKENDITYYQIETLHGMVSLDEQCIQWIGTAKPAEVVEIKENGKKSLKLIN